MFLICYLERIKSTSPSYSNPKIDTTNRESVTLNGSPASTNIGKYLFLPYSS